VSRGLTGFARFEVRCLRRWGEEGGRAGEGKIGRCGCAYTQAFGRAEASCGRSDYGPRECGPFRFVDRPGVVSDSLPPKRSLDGAPGWPGTPIRWTYPILDSAGSEVEGRV
jgi:hypothetical protein